MSVNYDYYRIFYYVAKYHSFTKAAKLLGSNQPNVSRTMNKLEYDLGCTLFTRSNRGLALTPEGELLLTHVEIAQEQLQEAEEQLAANAGLQNGSISIGASETALHILLLEKLNAFRTLYPNIQFSISNHSTPQALSSLRQGGIDLAVVTTPTDAKKPLRETRLMPFQEILVGGPAYAALAGRTHRLAELDELPLICLGSHTMTYALYNQLFLAHGLALHPSTEAATTDQILPLIKYNLGLGFLPEPLAREAIAKGEVYQIPLAEKIPARQIVLILDSRRPLSVAAREFVKILCG